ncbi:MAG: hypothetical protein ABGY11_08820, partial [Candidatus Thioglobus sp.]
MQRHKLALFLVCVFASIAGEAKTVIEDKASELLGPQPLRDAVRKVIDDNERNSYTGTKRIKTGSRENENGLSNSSPDRIDKLIYRMLSNIQSGGGSTSTSYEEKGTSHLPTSKNIVTPVTKATNPKNIMATAKAN